jgi:hypothetical protein
MAKGTEERAKLAELVRRSAVARERIGQAHSGFKRRFDVQERLKTSIKTQPMKWLGGSLLAGMAGSFLLGGRRKREASVFRGGISGMARRGILGLAMKVAKPALQVYATKLLKEYVEARLVGGRRREKEASSARHVDIR